MNSIPIVLNLITSALWGALGIISFICYATLDTTPFLYIATTILSVLLSIVHFTFAKGLYLDWQVTKGGHSNDEPPGAA